MASRARERMNKSPCSSRCWPSGHAAGKRPLLHGIFFLYSRTRRGYINHRPCPRVRPRAHTTQRARGVYSRCHKCYYSGVRTSNRPDSKLHAIANYAVYMIKVAVTRWLSSLFDWVMDPACRGVRCPSLDNRMTDKLVNFELSASMTSEVCELIVLTLSNNETIPRPEDRGDPQSPSFHSWSPQHEVLSGLAGHNIRLLFDAF